MYVSPNVGECVSACVPVLTVITTELMPRRMSNFTYVNTLLVLQLVVTLVNGTKCKCMISNQYLVDLVNMRFF